MEHGHNHAIPRKRPRFSICQVTGGQMKSKWHFLCEFFANSESPKRFSRRDGSLFFSTSWMTTGEWTKIDSVEQKTWMIQDWKRSFSWVKHCHVFSIHWEWDFQSAAVWTWRWLGDGVFTWHVFFSKNTQNFVCYLVMMNDHKNPL